MFKSKHYFIGLLPGACFAWIDKIFDGALFAVRVAEAAESKEDSKFFPPPPRVEREEDD